MPPLSKPLTRGTNTARAQPARSNSRARPVNRESSLPAQPRQQSLPARPRPAQQPIRNVQTSYQMQQMPMEQSIPPQRQDPVIEKISQLEYKLAEMEVKIGRESVTPVPPQDNFILPPLSPEDNRPPTSIYVSEGSVAQGLAAMLKSKDDEIKKLKRENMELRAALKARGVNC